MHIYKKTTGCSLNIVFVRRFQTPALQQNRQSSEKNHNILRKNTIFNEHPVYKHSKGCTDGKMANILPENKHELLPNLLDHLQGSNLN